MKELNLEAIGEMIRQLVDAINLPDNGEWYTVSFIAKQRADGVKEIDLLSLCALDETTSTEKQ